MERKTQVRILALFCLLFLPALAFSQIIVKGTVKAEDGFGMPGANVLLKGSTNGTITDVDGNYSISVPTEKSVLVFSFIGMTTQEVTVGKQRTIDVVLKDDSEMLDEVVVVGYGVQKKSDVTGAMARVTAEVIQDRPVQNALQAIQGKVTDRGLCLPIVQTKRR